MPHLRTVEQDWEALCSTALFEIPTDRPLVIMEHKQTKEHAYFDIKLNRFLSQQEALDVLTGYRW